MKLMIIVSYAKSSLGHHCKDVQDMKHIKNGEGSKQNIPNDYHEEMVNI
jgi:hypothetical protein